MTKVTINIRSILDRTMKHDTVHLPATVNIDDFLDYADIQEMEFDVHDLLAEQKKIALVWSVEDVQRMRRDLDDNQSWAVLQQCERDHDCDHGLTWDTIEQTAYDLFGSGNAHRIERCVRSISAYGDDLAESNLVDFMADAMHWCGSVGYSFDELLTRARSHFANENRDD